MMDRSWSDFFSMGGYALYVWGSYLLALLAIGGEVLLLLRRKKFLQTRTESISAKGQRNK
ncbi:MAG TPA: heme exporter protein CcmD [Pyrinomonadaceae bacterium]|nr:heme exporter protein CcmD [Pyrinomonadaceae bacterium]